MPLGWTEIKARAIAFSREWAEETRETAEAKSFWDAFFNVFGLSRPAVAVFDEPVRSLQGSYNRIDLFWKGHLLAGLYDPITMPPALAKAHAALDRAVDRAYRPAPFDSERARVEHLFTLYQSLTTLFPAKPGKTPRKKVAAGA
jgi:hypothetical protein